MGSEGTLMTPATWGTTPNAQPNHGGRVFLKKSFFTFFGAQKVHYFGFLGALIDFLDQHTFFGPKTMDVKSGMATMAMAMPAILFGHRSG